MIKHRISTVKLNFLIQIKG